MSTQAANTISVQVAIPGEKPVRLEISGQNSMVAEVLRVFEETTGLKPDFLELHEIRIDGHRADPTSRVSEKQIVVLLPRLAANANESDLADFLQRHEEPKVCGTCQRSYTESDKINFHFDVNDDFVEDGTYCTECLRPYDDQASDS